VAASPLVHPFYPLYVSSSFISRRTFALRLCLSSNAGTVQFSEPTGARSLKTVFSSGHQGRTICSQFSLLWRHTALSFSSGLEAGFALLISGYSVYSHFSLNTGVFFFFFLHPFCSLRFTFLSRRRFSVPVSPSFHPL